MAAYTTTTSIHGPGLVEHQYENTLVGDLAHIEHDQALVDKITLKRKNELQRRSKLLDPRRRQLGVDHAVLDAQVAERRAIQAAEASTEAYHAAGMAMQEQVMQAIEDSKQKQQRDRKKHVIEYSLNHLRKEQRREFDLSDPDYLKKQVRPGADGTPLGPSSMQHFEAHDLECDDRQEQLRAMQQQWLSSQMQDKAQRNRQEQAETAEYDRALLLADEVRGLCEMTEAEDRRQEKCQEARDNQELAEHHRNRRLARKARENQDDARHVEYVRNQLSEGADYKFGTDGRIMAGDFKRMTMEEEQEILNTNARLILEKQAERKLQNSDVEQEVATINLTVAVMGGVEAEAARLKRERHMKCNEENMRAAAAKRERDSVENRNYRSFQHSLG